MKHTYKICPSCLFFCETSEEDNFCSICGKELLAKCKTCGQSITNPYAKYCKYCGSKFPDRSIKLKRII